MARPIGWQLDDGGVRRYWDGGQWLDAEPTVVVEEKVVRQDAPVPLSVGVAAPAPVPAPVARPAAVAPVAESVVEERSWFARYWWLPLLGLLLIGGLIWGLRGCDNQAAPAAPSPSPTPTDEHDPAATPTESPAATPTESPAAATHEIDCTVYEQFGDLHGREVSVYTSIVETEGESQVRSYEPFTQCTGVTINYEGSREFEAQLLVRLQAGNAPDIAFMPQPGLLNTIVTDFPNEVVPAPAPVVANVDKYWSPSWKDFGTVNGTFYAAPLGANAKSFVWYSPKAFAEAGYEIPTTWTGLLELTDKMVADKGGPVWCAGVESGEATGWPGTDFIEDMVLRTAGPELYMQWYKHEIPFNDPRIVEGWNAAGEILLNPERVNAGLGGPDSIATTPWTSAGLGILDGTCMLHRAANFWGAQIPAGKDISENGDIYAFYFPTDQTDIKPVLGGGEFVLAFDNRPEVEAFQTYLSSADWANTKAKVTPEGGWVSANNGLIVDNLAQSIDRLSAKTLADPNSVVAFDASDMMPGEVGAGSFWTGIVDWLTGTPTQTVVDNIENTWPR